jgi:hypothetical protein
MPYAKWIIFKSRLYAPVFAAVILLAWVAMGMVIYEKREIDSGLGFMIFIIDSIFVVIFQFKNYVCAAGAQHFAWQEDDQDCIKSRGEAERAG